MQLAIDSHSTWHFVNGGWAESDAGLFQPTGGYTADDGKGVQGYHLAFCKDQGFSDFQARVQVRHNAARCDVGFIFRATDPQNFYMLHFPDTGQASRAQNFWVAVSKMDDSGVFRIVKLELVRRVASHPRQRWHDLAMSLVGSRLEVRIDRCGVLVCDDCDDHRPGYVGLMSFLDVSSQGLTVTGEPVDVPTWTDDDHRSPHWFCPCPDPKGTWQRSTDLIRLPDGEMILGFSTPDDRSKVHGAGATTSSFLARSRDHGRTWSQPEQLRIAGTTNEWFPPRLHVTPAGRLIGLMRQEDQFLVAESKDAARSWSETSALNFGPALAGMKSAYNGPQTFLNLRDGSMLAMLHGASELNAGDSIYTWGSNHCMGCAYRSDDDGRTWSGPFEIDNRGNDEQGNHIGSNIDLTEMCAAEVGDGVIMALIRPIYSPWMWETWSEDGGRTWSACMRGPFAGYATPNMLRTSSGAVLIAHRLPTLTVHCSLDGGVHWDNGTMIDSGAWVMGAMIEAEPDLALYVYWETFDGPMRAQFLRVTPDGLQPQRRDG